MSFPTWAELVPEPAFACRISHSSACAYCVCFRVTLTRHLLLSATQLLTIILSRNIYLVLFFQVFTFPPYFYLLCFVPLELNDSGSVVYRLTKHRRGKAVIKRRAQWCISLISASPPLVRRQKQVDLCETKASLVYIERSCLKKPTKQKKPCTEQKL